MIFRSLFRAYRNAYSGLPREVWMLAIALFVNRVGTMVLPFLTLYMTDELGFDEISAGKMLSIYGLGSIAGCYLGGRFAKRFGAIRTQFFFLVGSVPFYLLIPFLGAWWSIALAVLFMAFFADGVRPASATALAQFAPAELRLRSFGLQRMAVNLGISFGPAMGGLLSTLNFFWLFIVDGGTTLICAMYLMYVFGFRAPQKIKELPTSQAIAGIDTSLNSISIQHNSKKWFASSPLRNRRFCVFLLLQLLTAIVFTQVHTTYPLYLRHHYGLSNPWIGFLFAINTVVIVAVEMLLLHRVSQMPLLRVIAFGAGLSCLGFGMLPWGNSLGFAIASALVMTFGEMLWMPLAAGWVVNENKGLDQALSMGWYTVTYSLAAVIAPIGFGYIYQLSAEWAWHLSAAIGVIAAFGFLCLEKFPNSKACPAVQT